MKTFVPMTILVLGFAILLGGCATSPAGKNLSPLLVGVSPNYPPLIYKEGNQITGIEADLARRLGAALGRPVSFVELAWDDLIPALLDGRIEIIMSGMSVTDPRKVRIAFSDAYMRNSLVAVMKRKDADLYTTKESILQTEKNVGVLKGTTSDTFVTRNMPAANKTPFDKISEIKTYFTYNRIHLFIGDIYAAAWLVSENESELSGLKIPLHEEAMGWGLRKDDAALRESVNRILAGWKKDGTLKAVLATHVPYLDRIQWETPIW